MIGADGARRPDDGRVVPRLHRPVLAPTLRPGDVVILDKPPVHNGSAIRQTVEAADATGATSAAGD